MDCLESKGKTVDEAVFNGLNRMDLSIDEVDIEILNEGGGFFRSAKIRLTKKKDASLPGVIAMASQKIEEVPVEYKPVKQQIRKVVPVSVETQEPKNNAEKFLTGIFSRMGVAVDVKSQEEDGILKIDLSGKGMGKLIGRRGETLDSLQYLTSLVINNGKEDYTKVMLDTENYRRKREDTLKRLASQLADKVQRSGKRVVLEPMNPYERRILHSTLQEYAKVYTYSEGEDPFRSVVVALKTKDTKETMPRELKRSK